MTVRSVAAQAATLLVVVAAVVGIYLTVLLGTGSSMDHPPSGVSLVLATVVVAVLLQPLYRRCRRWWRRRLDVSDPPLDLVRQLPRSLAAQLPAEQLPAHMVRLLTEALRVRRAELWLQVDGQRRLAAAWPPGPAPQPAPHVPTEVHPIRHSGVEVGRLVLLGSTAERRSTVENRLLATYADQAGEVLVMLARQQSLRQREAELAGQAERLRAARAAQLVAERAERRRIERDLHDGAQQQLIALGLTVRLAARAADRSADQARATLADAAGLARRAGAELGRISQTLYPAALYPATPDPATPDPTLDQATLDRATLDPATLDPTMLDPATLVPATLVPATLDPAILDPAALDRAPDAAGPTAGDLTAALRDAVARLPIPIIVTADPPGAGTRGDVRGRTALYFVALEAIQNAAKHAAAGRIDVRIGVWNDPDGDRLTARVSDDGRGFDPAAGLAGAGLCNARARLDEVGGTLSVVAAPGAGTVVTAGVPVAAAPSAGVPVPAVPVPVAPPSGVPVPAVPVPAGPEPAAPPSGVPVPAVPMPAVPVPAGAVPFVPMTDSTTG